MRIIVLSLAGIGDTLFATPLIHELRRNFPDALIDAAVMWKGARDVLEKNPHLNSVYQHNLLRGGLISSSRFLLQLRKQHYDVSFNTHPQSRRHYRVVARLVNASTRISHSYDHAGLFDRLLVNRTLPLDYTSHSIENNLSLLSLLGVAPLERQHRYELDVEPPEMDSAQNIIVAHGFSGLRILGVHVGSGGTKNLALRRWPLQYYGQLIRALIDSVPDIGILLFGGPQEDRDHQQLLKDCNSPRVFQPLTRNIREAAALARHCRAFLSVDTAMMHVAAAMKVPGQVVIETPTWNKPIEPYGNPFILVRNPAVNGRNLEYYRYDGHGIRGTESELIQAMRSVTVESVYSAVLQALSL